MSAREIPSIDLEALAHDDGTGEVERARLRRASCGLGTFFLTGHGVDVGETEGVLELSQRFFALPQEERNAIDMVGSPFFRGYSALGTERTQGRPDLREQLDVGPEDEPQLLAAGDPPYLRLLGPNLWPSALPELRPAISGWMRSLRDVSARLLAASVEISGLSGETFAAGFAERPHERLKIIKYHGFDTSSSHQGVGEHRDSGFLTLIVHDGNAGLQIHDGTGYLDVDAPRGTCIAMLGRTLEHATNGTLRATLHRVVSPAAAAERISVAYFFNPRLDFVVEPLPLGTERTLRDDDAGDLLHSEYGYNLLKVVLRSHPHVAQRFFANPIA